MQWILDTTGFQPPPTPTSVVVSTGDVLLIPELMTGAGELEAMRFVGPTVEEESKSDHFLILLSAGVEYPEFPAVIVNGIPPPTSLRETYANLFDTYLKKLRCGPSSLKELIGDDESDKDKALDEFWSKPPLQRLRKNYTGESWIIPLRDCTIIESIKAH